MVQASGTRISRTAVRRTLTALAVIAVLIGLGVPWHRIHALNERRLEAAAALEAIQAAEEDFLVSHNRYSRDLALPSPEGLGLANHSRGGRFALSVELASPASALGFSARALSSEAAVPPDPLCHSFTLNQNGIRGALDAAGADHTAECWPREP
ncbi:MAG TPA: hypothetical protein VLW26_07260 [Steroidobacteraceae bacterium]|nr:hypothetical protein [Steroidobacteraceae bacterium]